MKLKNLILKNYRNCKDVTLELGYDKILIIGKNAQGKTNILESVYFLSTLKSLRTSNNQELINFDAQSVEIKSDIVKADTDIELAFYYNREKTRELRVNTLKTTPKNFKSVLRTVLFATPDLLLLRGNPSDRREWLDRAISQVYPAYDERLSKYDKIRIQKNNLLKSDYIDETLLKVYNEQMAIAGSNIIFLRLKFLKEIERIAREKHKIISESEELKIKYDCSFLNGDEDIETISRLFAQSLEERMSEEIRRGQSCVGPQRDDILFYINENEATKFASQGQQRTVVLALKLSELEIITDKTGENPVLLLDDVLAELDDIRQNFLLKSIKSGVQTIITSVDTIHFEEEFLKDVKIYNIENGRIDTGQSIG